MCSYRYSLVHNNHIQDAKGSGMFEWNEAINKIEIKKTLGVLPSVKIGSPNEIASIIETFLAEHAELNASYDAEFDDEDDKYGSPDAGNLAVAARMLRDKGSLGEGFRCDSSWESGGYKPYRDLDAREMHDDIVKLSLIHI